MEYGSRCEIRILEPLEENSKSEPSPIGKGSDHIGLVPAAGLERRAAKSRFAVASLHFRLRAVAASASGRRLLARHMHKTPPPFLGGRGLGAPHNSKSEPGAAVVSDDTDAAADDSSKVTVFVPSL